MQVIEERNFKLKLTKEEHQKIRDVQRMLYDLNNTDYFDYCFEMQDICGMSIENFSDVAYFLGAFLDSIDEIII